jgi:hypothetical protein
MSSVPRLIRRFARKYGIDPRAALAVARTEGGLRFGAVGDAGTSYGPFQLHRGGALPRGRGAGWANSPAGIEYAIRKMSQAGARGLTGRAAIESIVRDFERPADPGSQIAKALSFYGKMPGVAVPGTRSPTSVGGIDPDVRRSILRDMLVSGRKFDPLAFMQAVRAAAPASTPELPLEAEVEPQFEAPDWTPKGGGEWGGSLKVADVGKSIAAKFGLSASGKRSTKLTSSGGVSDHWLGSTNAFAYDLSGSKKQMDRAAKALMKSLGHAWDGTSPLIEDIYVGPFRIQIIYNTPKYGGHLNHIHFGVRRVR